MRRRLYFVLPNVDSARTTANDLLLARIEDRNMHFLARRGTDLGELREASYLQKSDLVHGAELGLMIGGACGVLLGAILMLFPPHGVTMQLVTILLAALGGAALGAWIASLIGAGTPNSRLKMFEKDIEAGRILLMVDVPRGRIEEIKALVGRRHPEATARGIEPTVPAFP